MEAAAPEMSYGARIKEVERLVLEIERSEDVERALALHETVTQHLEACRAVIERAQGRLVEIDDAAAAKAQCDDD